MHVSMDLEEGGSYSRITLRDTWFILWKAAHFGTTFIISYIYYLPPSLNPMNAQARVGYTWHLMWITRHFSPSSVVGTYIVCVYMCVVCSYRVLSYCLWELEGQCLEKSLHLQVKTRGLNKVRCASVWYHHMRDEIAKGARLVWFSDFMW